MLKEIYTLSYILVVDILAQKLLNTIKKKDIKHFVVIHDVN